MLNVSRRPLSGFTPQQLAAIAWGFVAAEMNAPKLFHAIQNEARMQPTLDDLLQVIDVDNMSFSFWSCALRLFLHLPLTLRLRICRKPACSSIYVSVAPMPQVPLQDPR